MRRAVSSGPISEENSEQFGKREAVESNHKSCEESSEKSREE